MPPALSFAAFGPIYPLTLVPWYRPSHSRSVRVSSPFLHAYSSTHVPIYPTHSSLRCCELRHIATVPYIQLPSLLGRPSTSPSVSLRLYVRSPACSRSGRFSDLHSRRRTSTRLPSSPPPPTPPTIHQTSRNGKRQSWTSMEVIYVRY